MEEKWQEFDFYVPVVNKIAAKWYSLLNRRWDFDELKNEFVLVYSNLFPLISQRNIPRGDFSKLLYRVCNNHIVNCLRSRKHIMISLEEVPESLLIASGKEFEEMYRKLWFEKANELLSGDARVLLDIVLNDTDSLEEVSKVRRETGNRKYNSKLCMTDLASFACKNIGWGMARFKVAANEVKTFLVEI